MAISDKKKKLYSKVLGVQLDKGKTPAQAKKKAKEAIKPGKQGKPKKKSKEGIE